MVTVIDMTGLSALFPGNAAWFCRKLFKAMAMNEPASTFLWWVKESGEPEELPSNVQLVVKKPRADNALFRWWNDIQVSAEVRKSGADLYLAVNGRPLNTKRISSGVLFTVREGMPDVTTANGKNNGVPSARLQSLVADADIIMTLFATHAEWLKKKLPVSASKIRLLMPGIDKHTHHVDSVQQELVKEKYSGGVDYFLVSGFAGDDQDLLPVLKAYSLFKKWQLSHMQLLVTLDPSADIESLRAMLSSYKYRHDVQLIIGITDEEWENLLNAAYCLIHPSLHDHFPINILRAMSAEIPVISAPVPEVLDVAANTIIYSEFTPEALGANLQLIYKDEALRSRMTSKARELASRYHEEDMASSCWNYLLQSINGK